METIKEKAEELVDKFYPHAYNPTVMADTYIGEKHHAKQCALICVEEQLDRTAYDYSRGVLSIQISDIATEYWQKVKQEIRKL